MAARFSLLLTLGVALAITGALAAEPAVDAPKQAPRQVCRTAARTLGSHIRARRCRTEEQWRAEEQSKNGLPLGAQVTAGQSDGHAGPQPQG